jgi:uncharacterized membrane protein
MTLLFAFLIGFFAGLRSLTAPAMTALAVNSGWLKLQRPLALIGSLPALVILSLLAVMELVADKLPKTPNRTSPLGLIARLVTGALTGTCVAVGGGQGVFGGALLGAVGGVVGCYAGYLVRKRVVKASGIADIYIALVEDVVAIVGSLWVVSRFS